MKEETVFIGKMPIMLKSKYCILKGLRVALALIIIIVGGLADLLTTFHNLLCDAEVKWQKAMARPR
jgi:hypothetical protein